MCRLACFIEDWLIRSPSPEVPMTTKGPQGGAGDMRESSEKKIIKTNKFKKVKI